MSKKYRATIYIDGTDMDVYLVKDDWLEIVESHPSKSNTFQAVVRMVDPGSS